MTKCSALPRAFGTVPAGSRVRVKSRLRLYSASAADFFAAAFFTGVFFTAVFFADFFAADFFAEVFFATRFVVTDFLATRFVDFFVDFFVGMSESGSPFVRYASGSCRRARVRGPCLAADLDAGV